MDRMLLVRPQRCIGCRTCEMTCAFAHGAGQGQLGQTRIKVYPTGPERFVPVICLQCHAAACVTVCPVGALSRNADTGAIELDEARCVRCRLCVVACPFGNLHVTPRSGEIVKCDLCGGDPACAKFCPTQALEAVDGEQGGERVSKQGVAGGTASA